MIAYVKQKKIKYSRSVLSSYFIKSVKSDVHVKLNMRNSLVATLMTSSYICFASYRDNET